jgi:DNA-binding transcriptional LysR family regulator
LNVRHLQLFYHVVRNRGISRAIGRMPFSIQQPALSEQMTLLEDDIGGKLFLRQPFRLTAEGHGLYTWIRPFFEDFDRCEKGVQNRSRPHFRVAAEEMMIQRYVGPVLQAILRLEPETRITCCSGSGVRMQQWLRDGEVDLIITAVGGKRPHGLAYQEIASRLLVLVVEKTSPVRSADQFWTQPEIVTPLICPCLTDGISQVFQRGLKRGSIDWLPQIVTSSNGAVAACVASGAGVGVTLNVPYLVHHPKVRTLRLDGFDPVEIGALWRPEDTVKLRKLVATIRRCVPK